MMGQQSPHPHSFEDWREHRRVSNSVWFRVCTAHTDCPVMKISTDDGRTWATAHGCRMPVWAGDA